MKLHFPEISRLSLDRYAGLLGDERLGVVRGRVGELRAALAGRVVWNVSSTAVGGGVAEMVRSLLAYARGAGIDARWAVIEGTPAFFAITKRLHNALHGSLGDGSPLGPDERRIVEQVCAANAALLVPLVRPDDVIVVHDPQPAAMIAALRRTGAHVVWRCHIGHDQSNAQVELGWAFLGPYVEGADAYVFSRPAYVPPRIPVGRVAIIPPSIDPFSAKNQPLRDDAIRSILVGAGLAAGACDPSASLFVREDGTPGRVDSVADVVRDGPPPDLDTPLVVQVSRWDTLKDPVGVLRGFAAVPAVDLCGAHLVLAGPSTRSVADDPEAVAVLAEVTAAWQALRPDLRARVHLASIPSDDIDENAAIVNALQRHAAVIVQKSLHEGFGLTVTEAMWKARPVVASPVGGIRDQVEDGVTGLLLPHATDLRALGAALARLLADPELCRRLGHAGRARVRDRYLGIDSLLAYGALIERLDRARRAYSTSGAAETRISR